MAVTSASFYKNSNPLTKQVIRSDCMLGKGINFIVKATEYCNSF
jgi:hypothetical protein